MSDKTTDGTPTHQDFTEEDLEQFQRECEERREAANAACRARLKAALEEMELIFGYRK